MSHSRAFAPLEQSDSRRTLSTMHDDCPIRCICFLLVRHSSGLWLICCLFAERDKVHREVHRNRADNL
jgi:hypothetical protein